METEVPLAHRSWCDFRGSLRESTTRTAGSTQSNSPASALQTRRRGPFPTHADARRTLRERCARRPPTMSTPATQMRAPSPPTAAKPPAKP